MAGMSRDDALLGQLFPMWQLTISTGVLVTVILCGWRLLRRGPSRMTRALIITGGAALSVATIGILLAGR
jgi:hypothetical protein